MRLTFFWALWFASALAGVVWAEGGGSPVGAGSVNEDVGVQEFDDIGENAGGGSATDYADGKMISEATCKDLFSIPVDPYYGEIGEGLELIYKADACRMNGELSESEVEEIHQRFYSVKEAELDRTSCADVKTKIAQHEKVRWFEETILMSPECRLDESQVSYIRDLICPESGEMITDGHSTCYEWLNVLARSSFDLLTTADKEFIKAWSGGGDDDSEALRKMRREENMKAESAI